MENTNQNNFQTQAICVEVHTEAPAPHIENAVVRKNKTKVFRCKVCRKTFRNHESFKTHVTLHRIKCKKLSFNHQKFGKKSGKRIFTCRICDSKHYGLTSLLNHQREHQQIDSIRFGHQEEVLTSNSQTFSSKNIETENRDGNQNGLGISNQRIIVNESIGNHLTVDQITQMQLRESTVSLLESICSANRTPQSSTLTKSHYSAPPIDICKTVSSDDGVHLEIPSQVKAIYLNSNNSNNLGDVMKELQRLNRKMDNLIKHLNLPIDEDGNPTAPLASDTIEIQASNDHQLSDQDSTVILEGYPPSYSVVQAAKEQQQQEYYALALSSRQAQQLLKTESPQILNASPTDLKNLQKSKGVDLWIPSQQYLSQLATFAEPTEHQHQTVQVHDQEQEHHQQQHQQQEEQQQQSLDHQTIVTETINMIPHNIVDKIFIESRSRANFAKNLAFSIFTAEERRGRNCTGRVFGKAQHKEQLDQVKLQAVKEATFRKYPCSTHLIDITWKKECITAIDSGLRNENRASRTISSNQQQHHSPQQHSHLVAEEKKIVNAMEMMETT